jgi:hypothetical protein
MKPLEIQIRYSCGDSLEDILDAMVRDDWGFLEASAHIQRALNLTPEQVRHMENAYDHSE